MGILSKPLYNALGFYFENLFNNPIRTKAITACLILAAGNYTSQKIAGAKVLNHQSLLAYGLFGLLLGGTIPHYFYILLEQLVPEDSSYPLVKKILLERLLYTPFIQALSLYLIPRLEGKDHAYAVAQTKALYWSVLTASLRYMTVIQVLNIAFVPPVFRVLTGNLLAFIWTVFLANKRRQQAEKAKKAQG